jgi:hypothetical protein
VKYAVALRPPAGLPDGLFSNQKSKFGYILKGLAMEDDGIFYGHLVHFTVFCYILWAFGIVRGNLVYFSPFLYFVPKKSGNPGHQLDTIAAQKVKFSLDSFQGKRGQKQKASKVWRSPIDAKSKFGSQTG